ncbi:hypothetical protein Q5P01_021712 [Channa striata]|uniref:Major facilitator superfamily (MFS) profile domain-containing protein n=1 Tax=Channa striata TaxID=64152 RepID=A0AA88LUM9_CHASR|nr:hypothetical protein Q5P01_021712 [Channa striata]
MAVTNKKVEGDRRTSAAPPEGGWGWMIVAGCFLATICIRAVTRCISVFFVEFQMHFEKDYSTTAWIHSLVDSTTMLCAPLGSFLGNHLSCRATVILGGLLSTAGLVLSSFATSLEYLYIFLGVLTGLGFALSYTPAVAMVGTYFSEKKTLAYGIALSGSSIGTFFLAPAVQLLIEQYSWRGALLILGGFVSNLCVCGALMRPLEARRGEMPTTNQDTEQVPDDCSQVEPKQLEINNLKDTQGLLITNRAFQNFALEKNELGHGNIDLRFTGIKTAECILLSNKLRETILEENKLSYPQLTIDSTAEDLKLVESVNLSNKFTYNDAKIEDSGFPEDEPTDDCSLDDGGSPSLEPLQNTKSFSRGHRSCLEAREEFGFLLMPDFLILSVSFLFLAYGYSAPIVYLVPYALSVGVEHKRAAFLMSIFGVSGIVGNITFGWIMDRKCLKRYRLLSYLVAIGMEGLCCMFVPFLHSFSLLVPFSIFYGYFDGAYVALIPVVTSDVVGSTYLTSALGMVYFLHAIPFLVSPPIGGWLVDKTGNYTATFYLSGASFMLSSVVLAAAIPENRSVSLQTLWVSPLLRFLLTKFHCSCCTCNEDVRMVNPGTIPVHELEASRAAVSLSTVTPPNRADVPSAVTAAEESGGEPAATGAAGAPAQAPRSNDGGERRVGRLDSSEGEPGPQSRCRTQSISLLDGRGVFQTRSIFHLPRRSSSGYFSSDGDSVPSSPLPSPLRPQVADKSTQTPSPTGQVMYHALQRLAEAHGRGPGTQQNHGSPLSPFSTEQTNAAGEMQAVEVGRELRRIGDEFNNHLLEVAGRRRWVVIQPAWPPHTHQDPAVLICIGLLLFVIGRIIYLQGSTNNQHQS